MEILTSIAGAYLILYLFYIKIYLGKWPGSMSKSFKELKDKGVPAWPFIVLISLSASTLLIYAYENWSENDRLPLMAIGALGIFGVGTFACFWKKGVGIWHYVFAIAGFALCVLSFWLDYHAFWKTGVSAVAALVATALSWKNNPILWLEVALAFCLFIFLLI